jgi:hypothetical protein
MWSHFHPPVPEELTLYKQTELTEVTESELLEYRKLPTYSLRQRLFHLLYFLIFGVVKLVAALFYTLIVGPVFLGGCALWRTLGRAESGRVFLRGLWGSISRIFMTIVGFAKIEFHGEIDPDARFIVANHVCFFDGWLFAGYGVRPLGKKELLKAPFLGDIAELYDAIPVDRSQNLGITKLLIDNAKDPSKPAIVMMPEGASTSGDYMLRFHLGAFLSDLPVQLVAIRYKLWGTTRDIGHISFFHNYLYHVIVFLGVPWITVDVHFLGSMTLKEVEGQSPRLFADAAGLKIANALGVRMLSLTSSALFKKKTE